MINSLEALLKNYHPMDEEKQHHQEMLNFYKNDKNCFERSNLKGHFTASAWLLNKKGDQFLMMHHKKLQEWLQLGGHCDGDNDVLNVALKEAQEESGVLGIEPVFHNIFDVDIHFIPEYKGIPEHFHYDVRFLLQIKSDEQIVKNSESHALKWFGENDVLPSNNRSIMRMREKWLKL